MTIRFDDQVVIVTGAGHGLGRSHALAFARLGAKVVVNDLGGARDGTGASAAAAQAVVEEIEAAGGTAMANGASVTDAAAVGHMAADVMARWGRIDVLVNNAGILRDKSFARMEQADMEAVLDVHLLGSMLCSKAVWEVMRAQGRGRIVMTTSSSGVFGNFGQANYAAAKMGLVGLMSTLAQEGAKYDIRVNAILPVAATRMTEDLMTAELLALLQPEAVTPAVLYLASQDAPNSTVISAGAGCYSRIVIAETQGICLPEGERTPDAIAARWADIDAREGLQALPAGSAHTQKTLGTAMQEAAKAG